MNLCNRIKKNVKQKTTKIKLLNVKYKYIYSIIMKIAFYCMNDLQRAIPFFSKPPIANCHRTVRNH